MTPEGNVIPFPKSPPAGRADPRLAVALHGLMRALDQQLLEIRRFREASAQLAAAIGTMKENLGSYRNNLSTVAVGVATIGRRSRELSAIMDRPASR